MIECDGRAGAGTRHKRRIADLGKSVFRRNEPRVPSIATNIPLGATDGVGPTRQVNYLDKDLLPRDNGHIRVLAVVKVSILWCDVVSPGGNVTIKGATRLDRPEVNPVHIYISDVEAFRRAPQSIEPDPGLAGRRRRNLGCGRSGAGGRE